MGQSHQIWREGPVHVDLVRQPVQVSLIFIQEYLELRFYLVELLVESLHQILLLQLGQDYGSWRDPVTCLYIAVLSVYVYLQVLLKGFVIEPAKTPREAKLVLSHWVLLDKILLFKIFNEDVLILHPSLLEQLFLSPIGHLPVGLQLFEVVLCILIEAIFQLFYFRSQLCNFCVHYYLYN